MNAESVVQLVLALFTIQAVSILVFSIKFMFTSEKLKDLKDEIDYESGRIDSTDENLKVIYKKLQAIGDFLKIDYKECIAVKKDSEKKDALELWSLLNSEQKRQIRKDTK